MIRAWIADAGGARETDAAAAVSAARNRSARVWIDIESEDPEKVRATLAPLEIHPLAIEDMVVELNRPKVDNYGAYIYLVVHSARWEEDRPQLREIDVILSESFIVTYHEGDTRSIAAARDMLPKRPELLAECPARLLHFLLDTMVDNYLPIMDRLTEKIDRLEDFIFEGTSLDSRGQVIHLKRGMAALRRIVGPERDTLLALTRDEFRAIPPDLRPYLRDVYDRLARVHDLLDSFRDEIASILELHVSLVSNRLNVVIKRLTVIATIGLPLTVVTSYYGMNFAFAEYRWPHPELYMLGVLAATALITWGILRWKGWY